MLYLLLAVLSSAFVSIFMRISETKVKNNIGMLCVNYLICIALAWGYTGFGELFPAEAGLRTTVLLGIVNGILFLGSFVLLQVNIEKNGVVLSSTFMKLGLLVTMVISVCFFGEVPGIPQAIGFLLAIGAILLINYQPRAGKAGSKWGLLLLLLGGGLADAMSKVYEETGNPELSGHFLLYTFIIAFVFCVALNGAWKKGRPGKWEWIYGILLAVPNFFSFKFLLRSLAEVPAVIAYPVYSVACILTVTLAGVAFFKERLEKRQWTALALILVALVLLNI